MQKTNLTKFFKSMKFTMIEHSPEILTGLGIAGMITTTVLAVKATPKALKVIDHEKKIIEEETGEPVEKLKPIDTIKVAWKCYIPAAVTCAASAACLIGATSVNAKRNAVLATAYKLSESALTEYREKVVETIGEKKEKEIKDKVDKGRIERSPASKTEVIITGNGETCCYDYYSDRHFKSDREKIIRAMNEISRKLLIDGYVSLNDFYYEIGLKGTDYGDKMGWNTDTVRKLIEPRFSAQLDEGVPCLVVDFEVPPKYDFNKFF